ncbi:hypothetical protein BCR37DRAFT_346070, partial [Protomyces lactucae-debilis]
NDEHCSACRGTGKLLCCDDCPRSFHFSCIEPPIEEADIPDEPYFCMSCWERRVICWRIRDTMLMKSMDFRTRHLACSAS